MNEAPKLMLAIDLAYLFGIMTGFGLGLSLALYF